jgi:hypothetical protein
MDSKGESRRQRSRILAPPDLQAAVVQRKTLVGSHLEECEGGSGINEGYELKLSTS